MASDEPSTLLVVEDTEATRYFLTRLLRAEGYKVLEAATGQRALELVDTEPVDLILLDIELPDMLGYDVTRRVKSNAKTAGISVLHLSASYTDADSRAMGLERGADAYLAHPIERRVLAATVKALLRLRKAEVRVWELLEREKSLREQAERLVCSMREASNRKNEFIAMLSHELRNPLAPIRNSLYVLARAPLGCEQARRAQATIERQVQHMAELVDDLLDVTRIGQGKIQLHRNVVELRKLLQRCAEDHRPEFEQAGVDFEVSLPDEEVSLMGDPTRIAQVIGNLLHNAVKFTPRGGRTWLSMTCDAARRVASIRVRDSGIGMVPETIARLFEPFVQGDSSVVRGAGGLGLGLALVKGMVELHGGAVQAWSDGPGKGSEFVIELPIESSALLEAPVSEPVPESRPRRILIIEDNLDAAESLREVLEFDAHQVEVAASGLEGLEKAVRFHPDVVLCDIGLPGMDGYEVARSIRRNPAFARTLLVALSGYAGPEDVARSEQSGFDIHLAKPPAIERLAAVLQERRHESLASTAE